MGELLEGEEVRWGLPGPRRTCKYTRSLGAAGGLLLSFPAPHPGSQRGQVGWRRWSGALADYGREPRKKRWRRGRSGLTCPSHVFNPGRACGCRQAVPEQPGPRMRPTPGTALFSTRNVFMHTRSSRRAQDVERGGRSDAGSGKPESLNENAGRAYIVRSWRCQTTGEPRGCTDPRAQQGP